MLGDLEGAYVLASETCALDIIGATYVRDVEPGEMVIVTDKGIRSLYPFKPQEKRFCIFEYVYFARPDSTIEGQNVYDVRRQIGVELAKEQPAEADIVVPVPDSGVPAAIGFAYGADIPFELGIIRNHYVGRTFIQPTDSIRHMGVKLKHNPNKRLIEGKAGGVGGRFHRARYNLSKDRANGARCWCHCGAYAHCEPTNHRFLFLWRRHSRKSQAARLPDGFENHERVYRCRFTRLYIA